MRILLLTDCYLPSTQSGAKQIHDLGAEFLQQGHQVTVLAPSDLVSRPLEVASEDGLRVVRVRTGKIKRASRILRALQEARLSGKLRKGAERFLCGNPCDLVIFYSPTIFFAQLVRELKARWGCPAYLILRDIFPQWAVDMGILPRGPVLSYFRWKERQQYEAASVIAVQSKADLEYFGRRFPDNQYHLEVLYNWAVLHEPSLTITRYRSQLGLQDKVVFFYGGNVGVAQDMDNLVRLAANVAHDDRIRVLIVGAGSAAQQVRQSVAKRGLKNIQILPPVGQQEYLAMAAEFDVGVVTLDRRLKTHNLPGKVLSYLYWGMPVLASINAGNDLFSLLAENDAGLCFVNGEDEALAAAAVRIADDPDLRARLGRNARRLLERRFSAPAAARQVLKHFVNPVPIDDAAGMLSAAGPATGWLDGR
ncbi:MAG TPA: glycosyltransferase family 4 protein [Candidatus Acidoferrales bacterium]|nr:glycosyltransferase family 4 protein [Candidatus Acidoferrales bacterium]